MQSDGYCAAVKVSFIGQWQEFERKIISHVYAAKKKRCFCWDFVFNHEVSPLRHIPDVAIRHHVLQVLGFMWAVAFAVASGSYTFMAVNVIGHTVLLAAAAITVATWTAATAKPEFFVRSSVRQEPESSKD